MYKEKQGGKGMVVDTVKETLCVNKLISTKKEILLIEGDMIVPDAKPDILNTICTSGVVSVYKKEILDEKIRIDGNINTYITYLSEDNEDKIRGINTSLDFSESIQVSNCKEGMSCRLNIKLKNIESKVINGRKVGIKATLEVDIKVYSNEDVEIVNTLQNTDGIQMLNEELKVNSLVGIGETKINAKDTIPIDNIDNLAEILKCNLCISDKDIKISYNKILTKAEAEIKLMYLTEDNRINSVNAKIPVVGFIDIANVTEENLCDVDYEIKNIIIKPNAVEEHSIYIEIEIGVCACVYEDRQINIIQDLYSPCENLEFNKKKVNTITDKQNRKEIKQIRDQVTLENITDKKIVDVDISPVIQNENKLNSRIIYEGELTLEFMLVNNNLELDKQTAKIPFEYSMDNIENGENLNTDMDIEVINQDFIVQDGGVISSNIDLSMNMSSYRDININIMDEIQTNGEREEEDYSIIMYIVKKDDTLWNIAKKFGSTIDDIIRTNGIEDESKIYQGQKIYIPRYVRSGNTNQKSPIANYA